MYEEVQADPQREIPITSGTEIELRENVAYEPVQKIELRENVAYGPARHWFATSLPTLLFITSFPFSISIHLNVFSEQLMV